MWFVPGVDGDRGSLEAIGLTRPEVIEDSVVLALMVSSSSALKEMLHVLWGYTWMGMLSEYPEQLQVLEEACLADPHPDEELPAQYRLIGVGPQDDIISYIRQFVDNVPLIWRPELALEVYSLVLDIVVIREHKCPVFSISFWRRSDSLVRRTYLKTLFGVGTHADEGGIGGARTS